MTAQVAKSVTISIDDNISIGDEENFLLYLQMKLMMECYSLHKGKKYRIPYELGMVVYTVVEVKHSISKHVKHLYSEEESAFQVHNHTVFKMQKKKDIHAGRRLLGYEKELRPLYKILDKLFTETSDQFVCDQTKTASNTPIEPTHHIHYSPAAVTEEDDGNSDVEDSSQTNTLADLSHNSLIGPNIDDRVTSSSSPSTKYHDYKALASVESRVDHSPREQRHDGVLVSAPAECGKTLLLAELQHRYNAVVYGKPISNLTTLFDLAAARRPCLVLVDDVDGLPDQNKLVPFIEKLAGGVLVVGTASSAAAVSTELRRPGGLCVDISLQRPDDHTRELVLAAMLDSGNIECVAELLQELVTRTKGASGQDLNLLVLYLLNEITPETPLNKPLIVRAMEQQQALSRSFSRLSTTTDSTRLRHVPELTVCGYTPEKEYLESCFQMTLEMADQCKTLNITPPSRVLLFGPSGCGKTLMVNAFARKYSLAVHTVSRADVFGKYFGESEANLNNLFDKAVSAVPCILHLPGFDGLAGVKTSSGHHEVEERIVNLLKAKMDGALKLNGLFVLAETSCPDLLDTAIIRRGRFHCYIYVGLPAPEERKELCQHCLTEEDLFSEEDLDQLTDLTEGYTMAEVEKVCREVRLNVAVADAVSSVQPGSSVALMRKLQRFKKTYCPGDRDFL